MANYEGRPIVLDNGSLNIKAGYAGESAPRILVPTLLTRTFTARGHSDWYVGENARAWLRQMPVACPVSHGQVLDVDELAIIWHYLYSKELRVNAVDHPLMLSEYPLTTNQQREELIELAFEKFHIPALFCSNQASLSLYASGLTTGLTLDIGNDSVNIAPVDDSNLIRDVSKQLMFGGRDITHYMQQLLISANPNAARFITSEIANHFKETLCHVNLEGGDLTAARPVTFETPDGQIVRIGKERTMAPEILFQPQMIGLDGGGLTSNLKTVIQNSLAELRPYLQENLVLTGGSTLLPGLVDRIQQELRFVTPKHSTIRIIAPENRKYSVWIGGSILASLNSFNDFCVKKKVYEELGRETVSKKFM